MALQAKVIKQKIKGVGNIRKITRTMEMVSVAKMKKAVTSASGLRTYSTESTKQLHALGTLEAMRDSRYTKEIKGKELIIIIGSNKGLCGSYNTNVYRSLSKILADKKSEIGALTVGKQAEKIAKRVNLKVIASFVEYSDSPTFEDTEALVAVCMKSFDEGEYSTVSVLYTEYIKAMSYKTKHQNLLPIISDLVLEGEDADTISVDTVIEPDAATAINTIVPRAIHARIHSALLESLASEHSSRMFAMNTATENAKDMLRSLNISYNRARQDAVTQELAEIAAGSGN